MRTKTLLNVLESHNSRLELLGKAARTFGNGEIRRQIRAISNESKDAIERLALSYPGNVEEFEAAIMWAAERGIDQDLESIHQLKDTPPFHSKNILDLLAIAEERISQRITGPVSLPGRQLRQQAASSLPLTQSVHQLSSDGGKAASVDELDSRQLKEVLPRADWKMRREIARSLARRGDEISLDILDKLVHTDSDWSVREAAAEALGHYRNPRAKELLIYMARTDPHPRPAEMARRSLMRMKKR